MKQKTHDVGTPEVGKSDPTTGDGVLKDLAAQAQALAPTLQTSTDGDPRRRGEIKVTGEGARYILSINGQMWAEIDWNSKNNRWCIQDCCGYCLYHVEHRHANVRNDGPEVPKTVNDFNPATAIEKAKEMIRNGSMPTPEAARATYKKNRGEDYGYKTDGF